MHKERRRPNLDKRLRAPINNGKSEPKSTLVNLELRNCGLLDANGCVQPENLPTAKSLPPIDTDPAQDISTEVGISVEVLEVFAQEQARVPRTNSHAFLDDQFPVVNHDSPRDIISDDYSEESMP